LSQLPVAHSYAMAPVTMPPNAMPATAPTVSAIGTTGLSLQAGWPRHVSNGGSCTPMNEQPAATTRAIGHRITPPTA